MDRSSDYITDLRRRLQEACQHAGSPEIAEAALFSIGAGEMAAGTGPCRQAAGAEAAAIAAPKQQAPASPADEGAGRETLPEVRSRDMAAPAHGFYSKGLAPTGGGPAGAVGAGTGAAGGSTDEAANEVLRLRSLKRQHEELREQLVRAEGQLRRLPPHYVLQLHCYLERHLADPSLAGQVQEPITKLVEGLCAACQLDVGPGPTTPEALLAASRRLLRDPHGFTSKLCKLAPLSPEEGKSLAPCLLAGPQYRRVREKEVNVCCEALHTWVEALYFYSAVSDQVGPVTHELDEQESLLRRLGGGKATPAAPAASSPGASPVAVAVAKVQAARGRPAGLGVSLKGSTSAAAVGGAGGPQAAQQRRLSSSPVQLLRGPAPAAALASVHPAGSAVRRPGAGSPMGRSAASPRVAFPGAAQAGVVRRTSASPPEVSPPPLPVRSSTTPPLSTCPAMAPGVQRMQSDKALTQVLRAMKKEPRSGSPEAAAAAAPPGGSSSGSGGATFAPAPRSSRQPVGGLTPVPERRSSLPSTLLETFVRGGLPSTRSNKEPSNCRGPPPITRSITSTPRL